MTTASSFRASRAIGALFFSLLGGLWFVLWSNRAFGPQPAVLTLIATAALALFGSAWRIYQQNKAALAEEADSPAKMRADRIFNIVNAGQGILMFVIANALVNRHYSEWVVPAIIFIVGLHFIPLAPVFKYPPHYITGAALMLWAGISSFLTAAGPATPAGCFGTGLILWASAIYGLTVKPFGERPPLR